MFIESSESYGQIEVYRVKNGFIECVFSKRNTLHVTMFSNLRTALISRSVEYGVDAIAWGSFNSPAGSFVDSDWAGTTSSGTKGGLVQSSVGNLQAKFSGTFSFSSGTRHINYFELGRGYTPAGGGVSQLFTGRYAFDNSILTGSTSIMYQSGDILIVNWTIQVGS